MGKYAIQVSGVSKNFKLPHQKVATLKGAFLNAVSQRRTYEVQHALQNISFNVKKGEFFGIVGRNGSGKSTLLKLLAGIYQPSEGSIAIEGKLVPFIELGVGFNPELTGRENIFLNGALLGFSQSEVELMYQDIVDFAELEAFMDQKLKNYSSGMQVRLAFALATRAKADVLLIDEVLAVGDADFQRKCFAYFKQLKRDDITVVFISHDMSAVREYCDRVILIDDSKLVAEGTAEDIAAQYTRLFSDKAEAKSGTSADAERFGDGALQLQKVAIAKSKGKYRLKATVKARQAVDQPVYGFVIKNAAGTPLFGTNTKVQRQKTGNLKEGQTATVEWAFDDMFNDGTHTVTVAAQYSDGIGVYDWWEDATSFTVYKTDVTPYPVMPPVDVTVSTTP